ncbi:long-chain-fatty-acid--CoA ligase [Spongorhabdus nitratireducens]
MRLTQAIEHNAQVRANETSTLCNGRSHTWSETRNRVARLASGLQQAGLEKDDRVAILSLNSDYYYESFFAIPWADGIIVPLNIRWSVPENIYALEDSGSRFLIIDDTFLSIAEQILERTEQDITLIYAGEKETPEGMLSLNQLISDNEPVTCSGRSDETLCGIFYTGGTTGFPKGVMLSHQALWSSSATSITNFDLAGGNNELYLHAAPMFHLADICMSYTSTLSGVAQAFIPAFTPEGTIRAIEKYKATYALLVPTMISMVIAEPALDSADLSSLKTVIYGASPITESTLKVAMSKLPGVGFYQAYGQTEMAPIVSVLRPEHHILEGEGSKYLRSAGRPSFSVDVRILDENHNEVPQGSVGQIVARGPNNMLGYWNKPKQTAEALVDGWVHTGDAGYMDEEGFIYLVDRVKDMIVSGGENIFSVEVENAVAKHDAVHEVVVVGIPSEEWGEQVHAIVRLMPGETASEDQLKEHCKEWIAGYKCPRSIEFRDEPFPMTGAGKIRKVDLRATYWKDQERQVN